MRFYLHPGLPIRSRNTGSRRLTAAIFVTLSTFLAGHTAPTAQAQTYTYTQNNGNVFSTGFGLTTASDGSLTTSLAFGGSTNYTATHDFTNTYQLNSLQFTNTGNVTLARGGAGTSNRLNLDGDNPSLSLGNTGSLLIALDLLLSRTTVVSGSGSATISGLISGSGGLVKNGAGTLTLSNRNNNFTGNIFVNQGTLVAAASQVSETPSASALGNPATAARTITVGDGTNTATLQLAASQVFGTGNSNPAVRLVANKGTITNSGGQFNILPNITLNGSDLTGTGGLSSTQQMYAFAYGTVTVGGTGTSYISVGSGTNSGYHLGGSTTFDVADATGTFYPDLIVTGNLIDNFGTNGTGGLVKTGVGQMLLMGRNTYTGTTTINGGLLEVGNYFDGDSSLGAGTGSVTINSGGALRFNGYSSAGSASITNSGTLNFIFNSIANSATITNNGGLYFKEGASADHATITNNAGGILAFNGSSQASAATITNSSTADFYSDSSAGSAAITNNTFLTFHDDSTADSATVKNSGVLFINQHIGGLTIGSLSGSGNVILGANALTIGGLNVSGAIGGVISGTGGLTKIGTGTLTLTGANTYGGGTSISAGTLQLGDGNTNNGSVAGNIANNAALVFANPLSQTYSGVISGTGGLTKTGIGTLTLTGVGSSVGSGNTPSDFNKGTTLLTGASSTTYASLTAGGGVNVGRNSSDTGILTVSGTDGSGNATTLRTGPSSVGGFVGLYVGTSGTGTLNITGGGKVISATNDYIGYFGLSSGAVNVSGISSGTERLASTLDTNGGILAIGFGGAGALNVSGGGVVTTGSGATSLSNSIGSSAALNVNGGSLTTDRLFVGSGAAPTIRLTNPTSANGGGYALNLGGSNGSTTLGVGITDAAGGAGGIRKTGTGTLTLNGANTFSGGLQLDGGTLAVGNSLALQNSTLFFNAGSVNFGSLTRATFGGLTGSGNLALINAAPTPGAVALTVGGNGAPTLYSGVLSGSGSLNLANGTLTLTGANTYTGGTTNTGTLNVGDSTHSSSLGTGTVLNRANLSFNGSSLAGSATITNNGGLYFNNSASADHATITNTTGLSFNGSSLAGSATITNNGGLDFSDSSSAGSATINNNSSLAFTGSASAEGAAVRNSGDLNLTGSTSGISVGDLSGSGTVRLGSKSLTLGGLNRDSIISGVISDSGSLVKIGTAALTLSAENTFTGTTTINGGNIVLGNSLALQNSAVNIAVPGGLNLNSLPDVTLGGLSGTGDLALGNTALMVRGSNASLYQGAISGTGRLALSGVTLTLTGANTYSGGTTNNGTLTVGDSTHSSSLGTGAVTNNASLRFGGGSSAGSATITNNASLFFANGSTAESATVINNGGVDLSEHVGALSIGTLRGNLGAVFLGGNALSVGALGTNDAIGGTIRDGGNAGGTGGSLVKLGGGILSVTGANTYTGGTTVNGGTIAARGSALGTGKVTVASGATLAVGEAPNPGMAPQATGTLTLSSLSVTLGSTTPILTFNLGNSGVSDKLVMTSATKPLSFSSAVSGSDDFVIGFSSATGSSLGAGTYTLFSFAAAQAQGILPSLSSYKARPAGNLGSLVTDSSAFGYVTDSNGMVTGLAFTIESADVAPEPSSAALFVPIALGAVGVGAARRRRRTISHP